LIFCGANKALTVCALALAGLVLIAPGDLAAKKKKRAKRTQSELMNFFLSPANAQWLRGAISYLADPLEVEGYLVLQTDADAEVFIDSFWRQRDPHPDTAANPVRDLFDERSAEADKLYSEAATPGHATDRGTIYVVYGPPERTQYDISSDGKQRRPGRSNDLSVETWEYDRDAEPGLDGSQPEKKYRFAKSGEVTTFFVARPGSEIQDRTRPPRNR